MKIFLSHCSENKPLVREFKNKLPIFLNTWLDEESLSWGDAFPTELEKTIKSEVDFLVIFLDKDGLKSTWVTRELAWAIQREHELKRTFILPILLPEVTSDSLPDGLSDRLSLRLDDFKQDSVEELAKKATMSLFQLVVKSYSDGKEEGKIEPIDQNQFSGKRQKDELREDEIKILLALNNAVNEPEPEKRYLSLPEIAKSINMQVSKVDHFLRKLEDGGFAFVLPQNELAIISKSGIGYLVDNNLM